MAEEKALPTEGAPESEGSGQRVAPVIVPVVVRGSEGSEVELDPAVFTAPVKQGLHYDAVRQYMAGRRAGTHATRSRGLVAGGGRKPWRQKGTGNARVGSSRNPLWRGGGIVFGPQPRDYSYRLPGRMQRGALRSALSLCASEGRVHIFEDFGLAGPSTRAVLRRLGEWDSGWNSEKARVLIVETAPSDDLYLSTRNLQSVEVVSVNALHCYEVLKAKTVLIRRSALAALSAKLSETGSR
jgi:large subunit ribosomal protein L4